MEAKNKIERARGWKTANWMMLAMVADMVEAKKDEQGKLKLKPREEAMPGKWMMKSQLRISAVMIMQEHNSLKELANAFVMNDDCSQIEFSKKGLKALAKWWWSEKADPNNPDEIEPEMPLLYSKKKPDANGELRRQIVWKTKKKKKEYTTAK